MSNISLLSRNLMLWRKSKRLTQEQLANMLGVGKSVICRYESGDRAMKQDMIIKIADALGIEPYALFRAPDDIDAARAIDRFALLVDKIGAERAQKLLDGLDAPKSKLP